MFASTFSTLLLLFVATSLRCTSALKTNTSFIAQGLTGTYVSLPPVPDTINPAFLPPSQGTCPTIIKFTAYAFENLLRIAPNGLTDPTGTCPPAQGIERPSIPLRNKVHVRPALFSFFKSFQTPQPRSKVLSLHASIPHTLIQCPNDAGSPFSTVNLASVKDYVIPMLLSTLTEIGLPKEFISDVFGGVENRVTTLHPWYERNGAKIKKHVAELLSTLSKGYYMHLDRVHQPSTSLPSKGAMCPFLGGALLPAEIKLDMQKLLRETMPMITEIELAPLQFSSAEHFLADLHCKTSATRSRINTIKLNYEFPLKRVRGPYGKGALLSVDVDGSACASMNMYRFLEAESEMQHSDIGRASRILAKRVVNFLVDNAPSHAYKDTALRRFAAQFPAFERRLREMRFKSSLFVARLNMSACPGFSSADPIDLIVAKKPSSFFYCNGFTDKSMDASHPCFLYMMLKKWRLATKDDLVKDSNASTVFLSATRNTKSCIYDSSKSAASKFRNAFLDLLPSPEPSPEELLEASPQPSSAPASVDVPVTIPLPPKRQKACFPSHALVTLRNGRKVQMRNLKLGDEVEVTPEVFSPVILFTHASDAILSEMVSISTLSGTVSASRTHLLKVPDGHRAAAVLRVGDVVWVTKNGTLALERIRSIRRERMRGLYNPHTKKGTILVSSGRGASAILASSYTTAVNPFAAHAAITPLRLAHSLFGLTFPEISRLFPGTSVSSRKTADGMARKICHEGMGNVLQTSAASCCAIQRKNDAGLVSLNYGVMKYFLNIGQLLFTS